MGMGGGVDPEPAFAAGVAVCCVCWPVEAAFAMAMAC